MTDRFPTFIYGTAWKEDRTEELVIQALQSGFTAIDTANQRKHYFEEGAGRGIQKFLKSSGKTRDQLFLQTKFTYVRGQDQRLPYDADADFTTQVTQSFESSLSHLQTDYIDSYVLHGPYHHDTIEPADVETWKAMENLHSAGKIKHLGISNVTPMQLRELHKIARIKPSFVQNRCYARMGWDKKTREFCSANKIQYQGFSLLTANAREMQDASIQSLAQKYGRTVAQLLFRYSQQIGMIPLTGTSKSEHMKQDLNIGDFQLEPNEIFHIETLAY